jgi:site-specific DNA recombinase
MKEKIGLLYRVSSQQQETDGGSLDVQKEMGRKISRKLGLSFIEYDEGVQSSYKVEVNFRPKLVELLDSIQKKDGIRKVWVFNTDRLGRTSESWYSILKIFLDYGVKIYIGDEYKKPYDLTNSIDKLTIGILTLISQYDNELRRLRSVIGKRKSLKSGNTYLGSIIPFGYSVKNKKLIINKKESEFVKDIFRMYDDGKSTMNIKIYLDKQLDINPRRTKLGWNTGTIQKMMRNTLYTGKQVWEWKEKLPNGEEQLIESITIKTPSIVKKDLWKRVNDRMNLHLIEVRNEKSQNSLSLLKGKLKCKECGLFLNHRFRETNHYYGRCKEYSWKYNKKKYNSSNCGIGKSLRMEETDKKVLDIVIKTVNESKKLREEYKIKHLIPLWDDEKELKKKIRKVKKYLRDKTNERDKYEDEIIQIQFEIRTNQITQVKGEKLILKFQNTIEIFDKEIEKLQNQLKIVTNSKGWIDWIDKMSKGLGKIKNSSTEIKKDFINKNIQEIDVDFDKKSNSHKLNIHFKYPIIGDKLVYDINGKRDPRGGSGKKYDIFDGSSEMEIEIPLVKYRKKQNEKTRDKLNSVIIELKEVKGNSLQEICNELNNMKLYTPTKKKWDKPKLSSYYKYLKEKVPKK